MQASALLIKELQTMSRQRSTYVLLGLFLVSSVLFIAGVTHMAWAGNGFLLASHNVTVFGALMSVQGCMVVLVLPAVCATLITREKEQATLGLLMMSNLSRTSIILDKVLARMILLLVLSLSVAPALVYLLNQGGLAPVQIMRCYCVLFSMSLAYAGLAVLISARVYTVIGAIVATYLTMMVIFGLQLVVGATLAILDVIREETMVSGIALLWPFVWAIPLDGDLPLIVGLSDYWYIFLIISTLFFVGCVWLAAAILPRYQERPSKKRTERKDRLWSRFLSLFGAIGRRLSGVGSSPGRNPVTWRETTRGVLTSTRVQLLIGVLVLAVFGLYLTVAVLIDDRDWLILPWLVNWLLMLPTLALICLLAGCLNFVNDRRRGYFDVLLSSPMSTAAIMRGKILGLSKMALPPAVLVGSTMLITLFATSLVRGRWDDDLWWISITVGSIIIGGALSLALSGMLAGLVAEKPMPAILLSLVFVAAYGWIQFWLTWVIATPLALIADPDSVLSRLDNLIFELDIERFLNALDNSDIVVALAFSSSALLTPLLITATLMLVAPSLLYRDRVD